MGQGETNLSKLLAHLSPVLSEETFTFVTVLNQSLADLTFPVRGVFYESEGLSLILDVNTAKAQGFDIEGEYRQITCEVHSSLDAVGMTAAMSTVLAEHNISANVVAAYYHDHIFVPAAKAQDAVALLSSLGSSTS